MKKNKNILLVCLIGLLVTAGCSDDDASTSSPFEQDEIQTPVVPPSIDLGFDQTDVSITEGGDTVKLSLNLSIAAPVGGTITVAVDEANSSATSADYSTNLIGDITISEGDEAKEFYIVAVDDDMKEDDKVLTLTVSSNESRFGVSETNVVVTISSNEQVLIVVERDSGKVFEINTEDTSDSTYLFTIMHEVEIEEEPIDLRGQDTEMVPLENIRSFVFDEDTGAGYAGLRGDDVEDNYPGAIFKVNMTDGTAVIWNDNDSEIYENWNGGGAAGLLVGDHEIYVSSGNDDSHLSVVAVDKSDAISSEPLRDGDYWNSGNGLAWGGKTDSVYVGGDDGDILVMSIINGGIRESTIELTVTDAEQTKFEADNPDFSIDCTTIMNMTEATDGTVYALLKTGCAPTYEFVVTIDLETGAVSHVGLIYDSTDDDSTRKQGLALVPEGVL